MMKFALITCLFAAIALPQESTPSAKPEVSSSSMVTRIVRIRYAKPGTLHILLQDAPGVRMRADDNMKVIVVHGGAAQVAAVEQSIHDLDIPSTEPKSEDVELLVSVIGASNNQATPAEEATSEDISAVVKQLRAVFPYKNYQMLSSMLLRSREGAKATNNGVMKNFGNVASYSHPAIYATSYDNVSASSEGGKPIVHLSNFEFNERFDLPTGPVDARPVGFSNFGVTMKTDVDLREGQQVVVGKANVENSDSAVFVVLTVRLVD